MRMYATLFLTLLSLTSHADPLKKRPISSRELGTLIDESHRRIVDLSAAVQRREINSPQTKSKTIREPIPQSDPMQGVDHSTEPTITLRPSPIQKTATITNDDFFRLELRAKGRLGDSR